MDLMRVLSSALCVYVLVAYSISLYVFLVVVIGDKGECAIVTTHVSKLDLSDPLYLHASDSSNLTITAIKLKGTENYTFWSNAMKLALHVKNCWIHRLHLY
jgi:hypothetical protein